MKVILRFEWAEDADYNMITRLLMMFLDWALTLIQLIRRLFLSCLFDERFWAYYIMIVTMNWISFGKLWNYVERTCGYQYEWNIPFGINENDKVILFLGDLDKVTR